MPPKRRARSRSPAKATVTVVLAAIVVLGAVLNLSNPAGLLAYLPYATVGSVLVVRRPGHVVGWLLLLMAALFSLVGRGSEWSALAMTTGNTGLLPLIAWIGTLSGIGLFFGMAWLTAVFPTGALPRGVTGLATRMALAITAGLAILQAVDPVFAIVLPDGTPVSVRNPIGIAPGWAGWSFLDGPAYVVVLGALSVCIVGLLVRFRGASGVERQQDKWLLGSLALIAIAVASGFVTTFLFSNPAWGWIPAGLTFPLPPIAIGIAILRFRLYEIDRIVSRTISYGLVTATLFASYAGLILLIQAPLAAVTGGDAAGVAVATLVAAALFQPLRHRIQATVDRRFNRSRYDSERALGTFSSRFRDDMTLPVITTVLRDAATRTVQPRAVSVWVRFEGP